ncbi:DUF427 domain-containing protein [Roseateles noduli]|uniref:DUF427 domain-containing protein n=1 Tax=Roseateles noduli TaxID=2052484 RepID=UPI003D65EA05
MNRPIRIPGPDHPITVQRTTARVRVFVADQLVADSVSTLVLREADYSPVYYFPPEDVVTNLLSASQRTTYCPFKGDCSYYDIPIGGSRSQAAVWFYREPYEAVVEIKGRLAFYPDRVDKVEVEESA